MADLGPFPCVLLETDLRAAPRVSGDARDRGDAALDFSR